MKYKYIEKRDDFDKVLDRVDITGFTLKAIEDALRGYGGDFDFVDYHVDIKEYDEPMPLDGDV